MARSEDTDAQWCRGRSLAETASVLAASAGRFGVARVGSITQLDAIGLAAVTVIRADPVGESVSVCTGKGSSELHARVGGLGEALERYCAEPRSHIRIVTARREELASSALDPVTLVLPNGVDSADRLDWVQGSALNGDDCWVPANAVVFPYLPTPSASRLFAAHTTGIASGTTREEALAFALLECIERDAYSRAVALASVGRGHEVPVVARSEVQHAAPVEVGALEAHGMRCLVRDVTCDTDVPVFLCTISDGFHAHFGCAARPIPDLALREAIREAAQSRLTDIQGAREDLSDRGIRSPVDPWFLTPGKSPTTNLTPGWMANRPADVVAGLVHRLSKLSSPVEPRWIDLSLPNIDAAVVRAVTPGLEVWAFDDTRVGRRAENWLCHAP